MYYMDCKEIFPSPFNPQIHLRYALFKNSSDLKLRIEIFSKFLNHSPSQLYIKKNLAGGGYEPATFRFRDKLVTAAPRGLVAARGKYALCQTS